MAANYRSWNTAKLKSELNTRGAVTTGRKIDLVERLVAYDRNFNFKPPTIEIPRPDVVLWPVSGYRQLLPDHRLIFTKLTKEQVDGYFIYRLAGDKQMTGDLKALEKGRSMYEAGRILACSLQISSDHVFLCGIVGAAMKNKITYNYKIKLHKISGSVINTQCECPAGKGPHATCKHIAAVLMMIEHFSSTGNVTVRKSCTEDLQTFHQPKSYYQGEPVQVERIPSKKKLTESLLDDPRPLEFRNLEGYNDHIRNATINFCASSSMDIAMRYLYEKADLKNAQKDHDYLERPFAEYWVDQALLIWWRKPEIPKKQQTLCKHADKLQITDKGSKELEIKTRGQADNKKWFEARRWRITASRFGEICKSTTRKNMSKLCKSILNPKKLNIPSVHHGKMFERKAIINFESQYKLKVKPCGLFVRKDLPYLGASPDGIIDLSTIVEVKCPYNGRNSKISPGKMFAYLKYNENNTIILNTNSAYYDQIQGQLYITKSHVCYFIVYTFVDMFVQQIDIDMDYCTGCLLPKLELFYSKYFRKYIAESV